MFRDAALGQEEIHFYFCVVPATIDNLVMKGSRI